MLLSNAFPPDPRPYREALALVRAGYQVTILCWDRGEGLPLSETLDGIKIERIRLRSTHGRGSTQAFFLPILWMKMVTLLFRKGPDILYCHDFDTLPAGLFARMLSPWKKVIFDSHEVFSRMLGSNVSAPLKRFVAWLEKKLVPMADHVVVTCPAMKRFYEPYGVKAMTEIGSWKDPEDYCFPAGILEEEKEKLGIRGQLVIAYIAQLGPDRIIAPLLAAVSKDPGLFLIVGGTGVQQGLVEKAAAMAPNIRYLGYVKEDKVRFYTALADVIYYGYDKFAGMAECNSPNKLFEALAAGKAFLGGDFGQMGEVLKEESCGIVLNEFTEQSIGEALSRLKGKEILSAFQKNAKAAALRKYNWGTVERSLFSVLEGAKCGPETRS